MLCHWLNSRPVFFYCLFVAGPLWLDDDVEAFAITNKV